MNGKSPIIRWIAKLIVTIEVFAIYRTEQSSEQTRCIYLVSDNNSCPFVTSNMRDLSGACTLWYLAYIYSRHISINLRADDGTIACVHQYTCVRGITDLWCMVCNNMTNWRCRNKSTFNMIFFAKRKRRYNLMKYDQ